MQIQRPAALGQPAALDQPAALGPSAKFLHKSQRPLVGLVVARPTPFRCMPH